MRYSKPKLNSFTVCFDEKQNNYTFINHYKKPEKQSSFQI